MSKKRFWNFIKNEATETISESVDLRIEGDIISSDDAWIYEWFGIQATAPNEFRNELNEYKGQDIQVWIDSNGGDVFAGAGIYNALKEHDGNVTVKINRAMSAASVIAMAGDKVMISPVGVMMIHNPLTGAQGDARAMRKAAEILDVVKETIINAYVAKTGKSIDEISSMMDDEAWMSANIAVKEGFADGVLYDDKPLEVTNIKDFTFNRALILNSTNEAIKHLLEIENKEGEKNMEIKNALDFKNQLPDIHKEVYNSGNTEGIKAERERLKAFDILNGKVDPEFLAEEKYKDGATAENVLFKAMQEGKVINSSYVNQVIIDAENANRVPGATSDNDKVDEVTGILNFVNNTAKKALGGR